MCPPQTATWDALAPGWDRWHEHLEASYGPVRRWLLSSLALGPGETLLELAAGPGSAGIQAVGELNGDARLISTDAAAEMVRVARGRGAHLPSAEFRVMDAQRLDLEEDSVDAALCESGYMLLPDPAAALSETRRVLRRAGRLALSVWGPEDRNPWDALPPAILREHGHLPPRVHSSSGSFSMADESTTRGLLEEAGFRSVATDEVEVSFGFTDLDEWERWATAVDPIGPVLGTLLPVEREAFMTKLASAFSPYRTGGGYHLPGVALCAVAV